uniref:Uncharacterized protein n=1 Tax=Anguilla anguilla TaxID=7936 RepID=A0A0E9Q9X3_ANGAN
MTILQHFLCRVKPGLEYYQTLTSITLQAVTSINNSLKTISIITIFFCCCFCL